MAVARGAGRIGNINSETKNRQGNLPFLWRKKMTVQELMEQLEWFPKDAVLMIENEPVKGCYYTRDFIRGEQATTAVRKGIVVIL
jgi:sulfur carrier protein ThiS